MISINMDKARLIAHAKRREMRQKEFEPHDKIIALQIPGEQSIAAEAARQAIRERYAVMQTQIDASASVDDLKAVLQG